MWPKLGQIFLTTSLIFLSIVILEVESFLCYTGDGEVKRTKVCPTIGGGLFSDICFKKYADPSSNEILRGCFNRDIAKMITKNEALGCFEIPPFLGKGMICLCDTELCNHAKMLGSTWTIITLAVSIIVTLVIV